MTTHKSKIGTPYYSRQTAHGSTEYSFSPKFTDTWSQSDELECNARWLRPQILTLITCLIREVPDEEDCHRAGYGLPELELTIATDSRLDAWSYQTGDNSFFGDAYLYPHWAIAILQPDSVPADVTDDIMEQLLEAAQ
jgi:hypothetical protein